MDNCGFLFCTDLQHLNACDSNAVYLLLRDVPHWSCNANSTKW